ncbi:MAG: 16S rRNA (adenine(1518)-N(6)/adenine(1519)-N(6))-dimethyltransferase RsmA [Patescibacteria group bacterium]
MKIIPKKSLGQHFLNSPGVLRKIVDASQIVQDETVLEIGPGTGVLTDELLKKSDRVIAIEKDDRAYALLGEKYATEIISGKLELLHGDILELDRATIGLKDGGYAVVANIPYYITGAILESFLEHAPRPQRMVLLVQKEVAERIVARDGKESILSVSVKAFGVPRIVATVPPGAFTPPPTVDSAILEISGINSTDRVAHFTDSEHTRRFFTIVKTAFAHKRKFTIRNLEALFDINTLEQAWQQTGLDPKVRSEDIPVSKWIELANALAK